MNPERLLLPEPPFFHWVQGEASSLLNHLEALHGRDGLVVRHVRGTKMLTSAGLLDEFAAVLQFPPYFGENWDAFDECLNDLEWLPADGYLLVVLDANHLLEKEPGEELGIFLEIMQNVAEHLAEPLSVQGMPHRPGLPFHVLLHTQGKFSGTSLYRALGETSQWVDEIPLKG